MLWEVEILPKLNDPERDRVCEEFDLFTHSRRGHDLITQTSRGYLLEGRLLREEIEELTHDLLVDALAETGRVRELNEKRCDSSLATVLLKPGVMDPAAMSVVDAARDLGIDIESVRTFRRYYGPPSHLLPASDREILFRRVLANEAIEQMIEGLLTLDHLAVSGTYTFRHVTTPLRE